MPSFTFTHSEIKAGDQGPVTITVNQDTDNLHLTDDQVIAASGNTTIPFAHAFAKIKNLFVKVDVGCTIVFRKTGPATSFTVPGVGVDGGGYAWDGTGPSPFTEDIVDILVTNLSSTATCTPFIQIGWDI